MQIYGAIPWVPERFIPENSKKIENNALVFIDFFAFSGNKLAVAPLNIILNLGNNAYKNITLRFCNYWKRGKMVVKPQENQKHLIFRIKVRSKRFHDRAHAHSQQILAGNLHSLNLSLMFSTSYSEKSSK